MAWDDMASRFLCEVWLRAASLVSSPCCGTHPAHAACTKKRRSLGDKELQIPSTLKKGAVVCKKKLAGNYRDLGLGFGKMYPSQSLQFHMSHPLGRVSQVRGWELSCHHWYLEPWGGGNLKEKIPDVRTSTPQMKGWNLKIIPKFLNEQEHHFPRNPWFLEFQRFFGKNGCTRRSGTTQNCCYLCAWCLDDQPASKSKRGDDISPQQERL